jgi:hypothetical protein
LAALDETISGIHNAASGRQKYESLSPDQFQLSFKLVQLLKYVIRSQRFVSAQCGKKLYRRNGGGGVGWVGVGGVRERNDAVAKPSHRICENCVFVCSIRLNFGRQSPYFVKIVCLFVAFGLILDVSKKMSTLSEYQDAREFFHSA